MRKLLINHLLCKATLLLVKITGFYVESTDISLKILGCPFLEGEALVLEEPSMKKTDQ